MRQISKYLETIPSIKGIVLSGGPNSVYEEGAFDIDPEIFNLGLPVLGICYGMQLMAARLGGKVEGNQVSEYGLTKLRVTQANPLTDGFEKDFSVWMSHGDSVVEMPDGFEVTASSDDTEVVIFKHREKPLFGLQFHPEVRNTNRFCL